MKIKFCDCYVGSLYIAVASGLKWTSEAGAITGRLGEGSHMTVARNLVLEGS